MRFQGCEGDTYLNSHPVSIFTGQKFRTRSIVKKKQIYMVYQGFCMCCPRGDDLFSTFTPPYLFFSIKNKNINMDNFFYNVSAFIIIFYDKRYPLNPVIYDEAVLVICHSDTPPPPSPLVRTYIWKAPICCKGQVHTHEMLREWHFILLYHQIMWGCK